MALIVGLNDLADALIKAGYDLVKPHSSTQELLTLLDETESLLRNVGQDQPLSMQNALVPSKDGLVTVGLMNHPDSDVRVSVVACLTEILRIFAPEAPYSDDHMKEIFRLTNEAFEKLADASSRSYKKAESVLDSVSRVRSCIVMLDLECYDLILQMFQNFLKNIRSDHSREVFSSMEMIMITIIDETEEVPTDLLDTLLASIKKENQNVSPMSWSLAEKVLSRCARKLKPYIVEALKSAGTNLDMYSPVVTTICQSVYETTKVHNVINTKENEVTEPELGRNVAPRDSLEDKMDLEHAHKEVHTKSSSKRPARDGTLRVTVNDILRNVNNSSLMEGVTGKRGRKPNSLMNPDEGYEISWLSSSNTKGSGGESSLRKAATNKRPLPKETSPATTSRALKRCRVKIDESDHDLDSLSSPRLKKLASCFRDEVPPREKESDQESDEIPEDDRKIGNSSKKTRSQNNGLEKSQRTAKKTKPIVEAKRSSARSEAKRKNSEAASLDTPVPQSSKSKKEKMVSQVAAREESEETSKSRSTRRQTARKEVESETNGFGEDLVGKRVNIWWPLDKTFYEGMVESYSSRKRMHRVLYLDGDSEELNLVKERWVLLEEEDRTSASENMEIDDLPESVPLIDIMQRQKAKKSKNVERTSSSGVRSASRTVTKKNSGKKGKKQAKRGKGGSKAAVVRKESEKGKNLKSLKELNAETERTDEQEVDSENEDDDDSEKQEQSENKSEEEESLELAADTEAETKEEEKQYSSSEAESERDTSGSEEPKWRETDDMEDEAEEEKEEEVDDKGTNTSLSETDKEEDEERDIEDEAAESEELVGDKGTNSSLSETEKGEDEERDMEEVSDKGTNASLSETEKDEEKEMEDEAEEREEVDDKVTSTKLSKVETEEDAERDMEDEAEEREKMVDDKETKTDLSEIEKEEDDEKDVENEAEERQEVVGDKGINSSLSEIEKEEGGKKDMEDEIEEREEVKDKGTNTNLSETEDEAVETEEVVDDKVTNTNLSETEKQEAEEKKTKDEAEEEKEEVGDKVSTTNLSETEKEEGEGRDMEDEAADEKVTNTNLSENEKEEDEEKRES